ncbi:MAG TPA: hypothetical protein PKW33_05070 [Anaerolineaceae bacterium]|nr:hypothetical protein [Anaerolineaceae bacterium]HPN50935.1 hypothetical protein [Anaerolineaceae bacterium]
MSGLKRALLLLRHTARSKPEVSRPSDTPMPMVERALLEESQLYLSEYRARLEEREAAFQETLATVLPEAAQESPLLRENLDDLARQLEEERSRTANLQAQVESLTASQRENRDALNQWLEAAKPTAELIATFYEHDFFAPGELARTEQMLEMAYDNARQGAEQAGLYWAQQACLSMNDLRLKLEQRQAEWAHWYQTAHQAVERLLVRIEAFREVPALDLSGNALDLRLDVDAWTNGRLSALKRAVESLNGNMSQTGTEELKRMAQNRLPELENRLNRLVAEARESVLGSQLRVNITDIVITALRGQGYELEDAGYKTGDMRGEYQASLKSLDGCEVMVHVAPTGRGLTGQELTLQSLNMPAYSEHELRQRAREVTRALNQHGIDGRLEEVPGYEEMMEPRPARQAQRLH